MKLLTVIILSTLAISVCASAALAGPDDDWTLALKATDSTGMYGDTAYAGTKTGGYDVIAAEDAVVVVPSASPVHIACYSFGAVQPLSRDYRAPMSAGEIKTWDLLLWVEPNYAGSMVKLSSWAIGLNGSIPVRVELLDGSYYTFNGENSGSASTPAFNWTLPTPQPGVDFGYHIRVTAGPAVPEPASLLGLLSGAAGMVVVAVRRRK